MSLYFISMQFSKAHAGKWVAIKGEKVIATEKGFTGLWKKIQTRKDRSAVSYCLVPKGIITGFAA